MVERYRGSWTKPAPEAGRLQRYRVVPTPMRIDNGAKRWIVRQARKHHWRVASWHDIDDLIQEGYMCWWKVTKHYMHITHRPHMMALFKTTYTNHIHALANRAREQVDMPASDMLEAASTADSGKWLTPRRGIRNQPVNVSDGGEHADIALLVTHLASAPEPIRAFFELLASDEGCRRLRMLYRRKAGGLRETFDERIARMTGVPMDDILASASAYITGD